MKKIIFGLLTIGMTFNPMVSEARTSYKLLFGALGALGGAMVYKNHKQHANLENNQPETQSDCSHNLYGKGPGKTSSIKMVCKRNFAVAFNTKTKTPLWVSERLTYSAVSLGVERSNDFHSEPVLGSLSPQPTDYARSGYDRGHMAPAADMPDEYSMHESFSMANMVPQTATLNRQVWSELESRIRKESNQYSELYVITGPVGQAGRLNNGSVVPTHCFKVVIYPNGRTMAYLVENKDYELPKNRYESKNMINGILNASIVDLKTLESYTGFRFY